MIVFASETFFWTIFYQGSPFNVSWWDYNIRWQVLPLPHLFSSLPYSLFISLTLSISLPLPPSQPVARRKNGLLDSNAICRRAGWPRSCPYLVIWSRGKLARPYHCAPIFLFARGTLWITGYSEGWKVLSLFELARRRLAVIKWRVRTKSAFVNLLVITHIHHNALQCIAPLDSYKSLMTPGALDFAYFIHFFLRSTTSAA